MSDIKAVDWVLRINMLTTESSSLEHWKEEQGHSDNSKEYFGEFCTPAEIESLKAFAKQTADLVIKLSDAERWKAHALRFARNYHPPCMLGDCTLCLLEKNDMDELDRRFGKQQ